ncbi:hypothetical protein C5167_024208 [Papaver somniferum]|uniref:Splicing factor YJU2 n=1 Tax=Papaver somniferum TaxID=3469 RepID=A0A4Y7JRM4_PAPSO|nr:YJU2 splicing factor homolog [Papaver somniferum]RZC62458.1 hypothetical protein C5167_024208 [Papaver somniferum]
MGERKVRCHYIPPDLDPAKIPPIQRKKQQDCRWMLPMSIRCKTCGNYMGRGTKVNTRKEIVDGETYLGIRIHRAYFKCSTCSAEFTIKTDPQNSDYTVEFGATRNFEPWRVEDQEVDRRKDAEGDPLKSLENRTRVSKREMDTDADIDQVRSIKARHAAVSSEAMLEALQRNAKEKEKQLEAQDEAIAKSIFRNKEIVLRIHDEEDQAVRTLKTKIVDYRDPTTGSLTKSRFLRPCSRGEELNLSKLISNSSCVRVSVIKKPRTVPKS